MIYVCILGRIKRKVRISSKPFTISLANMNKMCKEIEILRGKNVSTEVVQKERKKNRIARESEIRIYVNR